jgi:hypothetical protein
MRKSRDINDRLSIVLVSVALMCVTGVFFHSRRLAAQTPRDTAEFTADGKLILPVGYREWIFVGAPLTPNALNGGQANFPEFHHVYVEARNLEAYIKTGSFPEGTVFIKELTRVLNSTFPDGSRTEPSGRGYFNGEFNGIVIDHLKSSFFELSPV